MTEIGETLPRWVMADVRRERMRTMAAILRDPNPVHWDERATASRGLEGRVINQGPLNVGYIANMLMAWQGPACIRRLRLTFPDRVLDGEHLVATGVVTDLVAGIATCAVWLERPVGSRPVEGIAFVELSRTQ